MQMQENVLTFKISDDDSGEAYIDIAKCMSIINRKLFRQNGLWHVHGACVYAQSETAAPASQIVGVPFTLSITGAPRNWVTRNAIQKGFFAWKEQQKSVYEGVSPSIKPKWQDFKVYLNENHRTQEILGNDLTPTSGHMFAPSAADPFQEGDWEYSKLVWTHAHGDGTVDTHEPALVIMGDNNGTTSQSLIQNYQESRANVFSPDPDLPLGYDDNIYAVSAEPISNSLEEITTNMGNDNNNPPYAVEEYPGNDNNGEEPILYAFAANANTARRKIALNGFSAPNGVIEVQWSIDSITAGAQANNGDLWLQLFVSHREEY